MWAGAVPPDLCRPQHHVCPRSTRRPRTRQRVLRCSRARVFAARPPASRGASRPGSGDGESEARGGAFRIWRPPLASPLCCSRKERSARRAANASREAAEVEEEVDFLLPSCATSAMTYPVVSECIGSRKQVPVVQEKRKEVQRACCTRNGSAIVTPKKVLQ